MPSEGHSLSTFVVPNLIAEILLVGVDDRAVIAALARFPRKRERLDLKLLVSPAHSPALARQTGEAQMDLSTPTAGTAGQARCPADPDPAPGERQRRLGVPPHEGAVRPTPARMSLRLGGVP